MFKKVFKKILKPIKKLGKGIRKAFSKIGKFVGKLGPLGYLGMAIVAPYISHWFMNANWKFFADKTFFGNKVFDGMAKTIKWAGDATGKVYSSITSGIKESLNLIPGGKDMGLGDRLANLYEKAHSQLRSMTGLEGDPFTRNITLGEGDTIELLAEQTGMSAEDIVKMNPKTEWKAGETVKVHRSNIEKYQDNLDKAAKAAKDATASQKSLTTVEKVTSAVTGTAGVTAATEELIAGMTEEELAEYRQRQANNSLNIAAHMAISESDTNVDRENLGGFNFVSPESFFTSSPNTHKEQINKATKEIFKGGDLQFTNLTDPNQMANLMNLPLHGGIFSANMDDWKYYIPRYNPPRFKTIGSIPTFEYNLGQSQGDYYNV